MSVVNVINKEPGGTFFTRRSGPVNFSSEDMLPEAENINFDSNTDVPEYTRTKSLPDSVSKDVNSRVKVLPVGG